MQNTNQLITLLSVLIIIVYIAKMRLSFYQ